MAVIVTLGIAGCSDVTDERYSTLAEARSAGVFERGWLPDVLPSTAHDLELRNDLDLGVSAGKFSLRADELDVFASRLKLAEAMKSDEHLAAYLHARKLQRSIAGVYVDGPSTWLFVCDRAKAECAYSILDARSATE
jgi:hypothetical protein